MDKFDRSITGESMTDKLKTFVRFVVVQLLVALFFAVILCAGCASTPDFAYYVPGHMVIGVDGAKIRQLSGRPEVESFYAESFNAVYVNKYFPDRHRNHEDCHVAGYKHGDNWPEGEEEPRNKEIKK